MLKLFFNKESPIVYAFEVAGGLLVLFFLWNGSWGVWSTVHIAAFFLFILQYLFLRVCATVRWYPRKGSRVKYLGIELHFKKAIVPMSYIMMLTGLWLTLSGLPYVLYPTDLLFLAISHVNVILLYFHFKDRERGSVNLFSRPGAAAQGCDATMTQDKCGQGLPSLTINQTCRHGTIS